MADPATATGFPDVPTSHPFAIPVDWAAVHGITGGYPDGTFRPTDIVTRQAMTAFLYRVNEPGAAKPTCPPGFDPFDDVPSTHPFCGEILVLTGAGTIAGFPDSTFRPANPVTRQAAAAMVYRTAFPLATKPTCPAGPGPFSDVPFTHPFCGEIAWMASSGVAEGFADGTFRPTNAVTRQAAVAFLWRLTGEPEGFTQRSSVNTRGDEAAGPSSNPSISHSGRWLAFSSEAPNLVDGDTNGVADVFLRDHHLGVTTRVSRSTGGAQAGGPSLLPAISGDGRVVAFRSAATNLVGGDTNNADDVFAHDRGTGQTTVVSRSSLGLFGNANSGEPSVSTDGRHVAFSSGASNLAHDTNGTTDVFVHDRTSGATTRVSRSSGGAHGNGPSAAPSISGDGRYVAFDSSASNLVAGDSNSTFDVFVHDRTTGETTRVSRSSGGTQGNGYSIGPSISSNGRWVAFRSAATNLVSGDTNGTDDVFVHDRTTGVTTRVTRSSGGAQTNGNSTGPAISGDGGTVTYRSAASNLVPGDTNGMDDIFVHHRPTGRTIMASRSSAGSLGNGGSGADPTISRTGRDVAFTSLATNLVPGDTTIASDVFVRTIFGFATSPAPPPPL